MSLYVIAAEIGGTKLQAAVADSEGAVLFAERTQADPARGAQGVLAWFDEAVPRLVARANEQAIRCCAIGIGFGGPVETATGKALTSHQVAGWDNVALKPWFEDRFALPALVANDSNAAGWAEFRLGTGRGTRHFCYMNIGSGIGGALVIDGRLHDGQGYGAAEIGHVFVPDFTRPEPGAVDKLERLCSGWAIERRVRALSGLDPVSPLMRACGGDVSKLTCAMLGEAAKEGDAAARAELERAGHSIGMALANVLTLTDVEAIAVGGGVSLIGEPILDPIRRSVARHVFAPYRDTYRVTQAELGEQVVLAGAALLAAETLATQ